MLKTKRGTKSICDSCARAKSTRYVRRKKVRQAIAKQSKRDFANVTDIVDDVSCADEYEDGDMDDESQTSSTTAVTIGRLRDIAKAQPLSNSISIIFTDLKGPFKTAGLGNEIYAQSYIEGDTKFLRRYYFTFKSEALANLRDLLDV